MVSGWGVGLGLRFVDRGPDRAAMRLHVVPVGGEGYPTEFGMLDLAIEAVSVQGDDVAISDHHEILRKSVELFCPDAAPAVPIARHVPAGVPPLAVTLATPEDVPNTPPYRKPLPA